VLAIPSKRHVPSCATYLEPAEVRKLLAPARSGTRHWGFGTTPFLLFLYNHRARISEALSVRMTDLCLTRPRQVRLHGKGGRDRIMPALERERPRRSNASILHAGGHRYSSRKCTGTATDTRRSGPTSWTSNTLAARNMYRTLRKTTRDAGMLCGIVVRRAAPSRHGYRGHPGLPRPRQHRDDQSVISPPNLAMKRKALEAFWETIRPDQHKVATMAAPA